MSWSKRIGGTLSVRGNEWPVLSLMLINFMLLLGNQTILRSLNTGLFLGAFPPSAYPWYFIAESVLTFTLSMGYSVWILGRLDRRSENLGLLLIFVLVLLSGRMLLLTDQPWVYFTLPMITDSLLGLLIIQTWALYADCLDSRQAKRLFPLVGVGGTCGAILGGGMTLSLVSVLGTANLIFVSVLLLSLIALTTTLLMTFFLQETQSATPSGPQLPLRQQVQQLSGKVRGNQLLLLVVFILICVRVASTLGDYHLQVQLRQAFGTNEITGYMGSYFAITNLCTLIIQALLENRLINAFGVVFGMASTPLAMGVGLMGFWLSPSLLSITSTKFFEHITRNSVFKTASELVYLPFDSMTRRQLKLVVNGLLGLATVPLVSVVILLMGTNLSGLTLLALISSAAALVLSIILRVPYTEKLHASLMRRRLLVEDELSPFKGQGQAHNPDVLLHNLEGTDTDLVLFTLHLLKHEDIDIPVAHLLPLLEHENPFVREGALHILKRRGTQEHVEAVLWLLRHESDTRVRHACFRFLREVADENINPVALTHLQDPSVRVQAEALVFLFTRGGIEGILAGAEHLKAMLHRTYPEQESAAYIIGEIGVRYFRADFQRLLTHPEPWIHQEAIRAAGRSPEIELLPQLFSYLALPGTAELARQSLSRYPAEIVLARIERDFKASKDLNYQKALIRLTGSFERKEALHLLIEMMLEPDIQIKHRALKEVARLQRAHPFDISDVRHKIYYQIQREFRYGYSYYFLLSLVYDNPIDSERSQLMVAELKQRLQFVEMMLFRLLGMLFNPTDMYKAYLNYRSKAPYYRALSLEVLNYTLSKDLVEPVLTLLDEVPLETKLAVGRERAFVDDYIGQAWWNSALVAEDPWLQRISRWIRNERPRPEEQPMFEALDTVYQLKRIDLFKPFSAEQLLPVAQVCREHLLPPRSEVFGRHSQGDAFYLIARGEVEIVRNGRRMNLLTAGSCFGEVEILNASPRLAEARTLSECELLSISREDFIDLVEEYPEFSRGLLDMMSQYLSTTLNQLEDSL